MPPFSTFLLIGAYFFFMISSKKCADDLSHSVKKFTSSAVIVRQVEAKPVRVLTGSGMYLLPCLPMPWVFVAIQKSRKGLL